MKDDRALLVSWARFKIRTLTVVLILPSTALPVNPPMQVSSFVNAALNVSLTNAHSISTMITELPKIHGMKPTEAAAIQDCTKTIGDSADELQRSMAEMSRLGDPNSVFRISNIQTWVSHCIAHSTVFTNRRS
uniref:Pectinesterase inhibitor domain-containing protein n=1 Tax=Nelumbo nucifera TaxID=4432 RepID=A0A822Y2E3_NELNU|nr:TPA_asm: hypothetical protein HUJ06_027890 [Nelumbo nucifera]